MTSAAEPYTNEIVIAPDGSVYFKHLDADLASIALALDPHDRRAADVVARRKERP